MDNIILEIDGVRHRLVYDPTQIDCTNCSLKSKEHCNGNLCITLTKDVRYHFIKEENKRMRRLRKPS